MSNNLIPFVRRFGHEHLFDNKSPNGKALCGMPLLSNNYAKAIPPEDRTPCKDCFDVKRRMKS